MAAGKEAGEREEQPGLLSSVTEKITGAVVGVKETVEHAVSRLLERVEKAALGRDQVAVERLNKLLLALRPDDTPQERVWAFPPLAARLGARALIEALVTAAKPLSPEVRSVRP